MDSGFSEWLHQRNVEPGHIVAYQRAADAILSPLAAGGPVLPKHVDMALHDAHSRGASKKQLADMKQIGDALVQYERERIQASQATSSADAPVATEVEGSALPMPDLGSMAPAPAPAMSGLPGAAPGGFGGAAAGAAVAGGQMAAPPRRCAG